MEAITLKFSIGSHVVGFFSINGIIEKAKIVVDKNGIEIKYRINGKWYFERDLFENEEVLNKHMREEMQKAWGWHNEVLI